MPHVPHGPGSLGRMIRNSGFNAVGTILSLGLNFVAIFVLARRLGKEALGLYFTIFTVALVVYFILDSGITMVLTRRIARGTDQLKRHVSEATGLLAVASLAAIVIMSLLGVAWAELEPLVGKTRSSINLSAGGIIFIFTAAGMACAGRLMLEFYAAVFRGLELFEYENVARVIQASLFAGLIALGVHPPDETGLYMAVAALVISNVAGGTYIAIVLARGWHCVGFSLSRKVLADWVPESLPLGIGDLVQRVTWQIDTLLLSWLRPLAEVGLYSIAYRPLQPLNLVPRTVLSVTFPHFSRLADTSPIELGQAFARSIRWLWIVSLPISITICVWAEPLVILAAGERYREAAVPLRLLIWIVNLSFVSTQFRFLFTALGRQRAFAKLVLPILVFKIVIELALIPQWHYFGAIAGSCLAEFTLVAVGLMVCRQLGLGNLEWSLMGRATAAAVLMFLMLWPLRATGWPLLITGTAVTGMIYFACCVALGALPKAELARLADTCKSLVAARRAKRDQGSEARG